MLPEGDLPSAVVFTPDGAHILVSHTLSKNAVVLDAATRVVQQTIAVSGSPQGVAVSADGIHAVTANLFENRASILDLNTGLEVGVVSVGNQPGGVRITPNGLTAVISNAADDSLSVVDIATATELHRIPGAGFAASTALTPKNGVARASFTQFEIASNTLAVMPDFAHDEIDFFDLPAGTVRSVASVARPYGISITPDGGTAVVSHFFPETSCSVVDIGTQTITKNIDLSSSHFVPITMRLNGQSAVCAIQNACVVVNLVSNAISASISTASVNQLY
ncbi:MAG: YVTN family beta-propeller protein, partial [Candidatus Paceibacteria bacterium]